MKPRLISVVGVALVVIIIVAGTMQADGTRSISCARFAAGNGRSARRATHADTRSHVFVIVLENRGYRDVIGNPDAPYLNCFARRHTIATRYFAIIHPSLPNYLTMIGGSTFAVTSDCTRCSAIGMSLPQQLYDAGIGWRAYMQGMPRPCFLGGEHGRYAKKHDPFAYFPAVTSNPAMCNRIVPASRLDRDIHDGTLPSFSWLTPDLCNDAHDCSIAVSSRYLASLLPRLMRHLGPHGFILITFDEGRSDAGCCDVAHGGRIPMILAGPDVRRGARVAELYTHYSLLRTLEDVFGVGYLHAAAPSASMRAAFTELPRLR